MWRNRVDQNVFFYQRDAVGKPDEYKWSVRKRESNGKFAEVTHGVDKYDPQYFGCYASHSAGAQNRTKYVDERANVWSSPILRRWLPVYASAALVGLAFVVWAFQGGLANAGGKKPATPEKAQSLVVEKPAERAAPVEKTVAKEVAIDDSKILPGGDLVDELTARHRIRVGGTVTNGKGQQAGFLEWRGTENAIKEMLTYRQLAGLGWLVMVSVDGDFVVISKLNRRYYATAWPVEDVTGRASQATQREVAGVAVKPS